MPVSASRAREVRSTLQDIAQMLRGEPEYEAFVTSLQGAQDSLDETVDDRGQFIEHDDGPTLGSRVKQDDDSAEADNRPGGANAPAGDDKRPTNFGGSR